MSQMRGEEAVQRKQKQNIIHNIRLDGNERGKSSRATTSLDIALVDPRATSANATPRDGIAISLYVVHRLS